MNDIKMKWNQIRTWWKEMDRAHKKRSLLAVAGALLILLMAVLPVLAERNVESSGYETTLMKGVVSRGDIVTEIHGGGTLAEESASAIRLPDGVKLTEFYVENYTYVTEGTPLAGVDRVSVMNAISGVQETLDYLKEQIEKADHSTASVTVSAPVSGLVKAVYGAQGDDVAAVMAEYGALAVLSLDGLMAVEFETTASLSAGDRVWVALSDGREVYGTVETALNGTAVVTVEDDGYPIGDEVVITDSDDKHLGTGTLYVHYAWNVTAYSGEIAQVNVGENTDISKNTRMMTLKGVDASSEYEMLVKQHREYEELMLELFVMYQEQAILAPCDGVVSGVERDSIHLLAAANDGYSLSLLANAPNGNDEIGYTNFVGQIEIIGTDAWSVRMNPTAFAVNDYLDLSGVDLRTELMTQPVNYSFTAPVYELADGTWVQISAADLQAGDILLFAGDESGNCVWMVRVQKASPAPEASPDVSPEVSPQVSPEVSPSVPSDGEQGTQGGVPNPGIGGGMQGGMEGGMPSMGGFGTVTEEFELFDLEGTDILFVTPQDTVTLTISVDERDVAKLAVGQTAEVTVDVLKGVTYTAEVTEVGMTGTSDGGSSKFSVVLTMERAENMLSGMHATAVLTQAVTEDALLVPVAALVELGNETVIYTKQSAEALSNPVAVTTGVSDGEYVEILSGLAEGDSYCYAYYEAPDVDTKAK